MEYQESRIERRRHVRVAARGAVILRGDNQELHGRAVVVSETALEVRCQPGLALVAMAGAPVEVEMRLDGEIGGWFILHGQVQRVRDLDHRLVITITTLPGPLASLIAKTAGRSGLAPIEVMIVDAAVAERTRVAEAFRAEGCHVVEAGTPLEAIGGLEGSASATTLIAVADTIPDRIGIELRDYLDSMQEGAFIVALGEPEWTPTRTRLDPSNADGLLDARIRALLLMRSGLQPSIPVV